MVDLPFRPRRNRVSGALRELARETRLHPGDFIWPVFIQEGDKLRTPIGAMPGIDRLSIDLLVEEAKKAADLGIPAIALFPKVDDSLKDSLARQSHNPKGLLPRAVTALKKEVPQLAVITDVAMDPYSSDGHDGIVRDGTIVNDDTLEVLAKMAVCQAQAGADVVAPSDMMDGRVGYLRCALDGAGFDQVGILAYSAKYCSAFYGPFREALDSAPRGGDKKTYQMDPANWREALREVTLDLEQGADMVMVKPALPYLDIICRVRELTDLPVAAYHVSGEYAMVMAAGQQGWLDAHSCLMESLLAIKRAGATAILTYYACQAAERL